MIARLAKAGLASTAALVLALSLQAPAYAATGPTYNLLFSFNATDGAFATAGVIRDAAGNLYGTTKFAGAQGTGNVYRLAPDGTETVLFAFSDGTDGGHPQAGVIRDAAGNLYGAAQDGGDLSCNITATGIAGGCGVVYKLSPTGQETVLHRFSGPDGATADEGLVRDAEGNLYGVTSQGGDLNCAPGNRAGCGVVYKISPTGQETVLHTFSGPDGSGPSSALLLDAAGNLYGTTFGGGPDNGGTLFKLDPAGRMTILHSFGAGNNSPRGPEGNLIRDEAGNFYGTTTSGGSAHFFGTVYKVDEHGNETVLHSFSNDAPDGQMPDSGVVRDAAGNLYGTTPSGGDPRCESGPMPGCGIVYRIDTSRRETILHTFRATDGASPTAAPILDPSGSLIGTVTAGALNGFGGVFTLTP